MSFHFSLDDDNKVLMDLEVLGCTMEWEFLKISTDLIWRIHGQFNRV